MARADTRPYDFQGRLAFSWPARRNDAVLNQRTIFRIPEAPEDPAEPIRDSGDPLFPLGYGLTYADAGSMDLPQFVTGLDEEEPVPGPVNGGECVDIDLRGGRFSWQIRGHNTWSGRKVNYPGEEDILIMRVADARENRSDDDHDAMRIRFHAFPAFIYAEYEDGTVNDLRSYVSSGAMLRFEIRVFAKPSGPLFLACHDDYPSQPAVDLWELVDHHHSGWQSVCIPLSALSVLGMDFRYVNVPFMLYSANENEVGIRRIRIANNA